MSAGRVVAVLVAGLALVGFAMWVASQRHLERATLAGDLVLPDLEHHVNAVTEVALRKADGTHATLKRNGAGWSVGERGWPADRTRCASCCSISGRSTSSRRRPPCRPPTRRPRGRTSTAPR